MSSILLTGKFQLCQLSEMFLGLLKKFRVATTREMSFNQKQLVETVTLLRRVVLPQPPVTEGYRVTKWCSLLLAVVMQNIPDPA